MALPSPLAIRADRVSKSFMLYGRPIDRLKQGLFGRYRQFGRAFHALTEVSFALPRGRVLGLIGNNGAGKSTLLQLVSGILTPTSGEVEVNGRVAALLELGAGFNLDFSGRENIFLNAAVIGLGREEIHARYDDIVGFADIGDFIEQPVKTYSSGMVVRLAFAIATAADPDILVIDEALSVGDGAFARKSFDRIMALKSGGATILFCSHSMYHIEAICDEAMWLDRGRVAGHGTPVEVVKAYADAQRPVGSRQPDAVWSAPPAAGGCARLVRAEARVDGQGGPVLPIVAGVSELEVEVEFLADPALPPPSVAFDIETVGGVTVSSACTRFDGYTASLDEHGRGRVILRLPGVSLMRGRYRLSIYLACERALHVYDHARFLAELDVRHDGKEQGVVFLPRAWGDGPVATVPPPSGMP